MRIARLCSAWFVALTLTLAAAPASAAYLVIENTWPAGDFWTGQNLPTDGYSVTGLILYLTITDPTDGSVSQIAICSKDSTQCGFVDKKHQPAASIPLNLTAATPLAPGQTFTSQRLVGVPDTNFLLHGASVGGFGPGVQYSTGVVDVQIDRQSILPNVLPTPSDEIHFQVYRADGSLINVATVTFFKGRPPKR